MKRKSNEDDENNFDKNKSANEWAKLKEKCKKSKSSLHENYDASQFISPFRKPLINVSNGSAQSTASSSTSSTNDSSLNASSKSHEDFIKSLTNKPFKIPIPNYQASSSFRSLGTRRQGTRQPLHDPEQENALILWSPPEISATELLKVDK